MQQKSNPGIRCGASSLRLPCESTVVQASARTLCTQTDASARTEPPDAARAERLGDGGKAEERGACEGRTYSVPSLKVGVCVS